MIFIFSDPIDFPRTGQSVGVCGWTSLFDPLSFVEQCQVEKLEDESIIEQKMYNGVDIACGIRI